MNKEFLSFIQRRNHQSTATLDMDATLAETNKSEALYCYKGYRSYQPINTWWSDQELIVHTEFSDGNVIGIAPGNHGISVAAGQQIDGIAR